MVTAAHCLYKDDELLAAKSLSILLGLHDRNKKTEPKRCFRKFFLRTTVFLAGGKSRLIKSLSMKTTLPPTAKQTT